MLWRPYHPPLQLPMNRDVAARLAEAVKAVAPKNAGEALAKCRELAMQVRLCFASWGWEIWCSCPPWGGGAVTQECSWSPLTSV